jgi:hypothetical protein
LSAAASLTARRSAASDGRSSIESNPPPLCRFTALAQQRAFPEAEHAVRLERRHAAHRSVILELGHAPFDVLDDAGADLVGRGGADVSGSAARIPPTVRCRRRPVGPFSPCRILPAPAVRRRPAPRRCLPLACHPVLAPCPRGAAAPGPPPRADLARPRRPFFGLARANRPRSASASGISSFACGRAL